jgi:hypothetical protein
MQIQEIKEFAEIRVKARAYMCYLLSRHITHSLTEANNATMQQRLKQIADAIPNAEVVYTLDQHGKQVATNASKHKILQSVREGEDRSGRAYFYRTIKEHRCTLTDPYPSLYSNKMVVTASIPVYNEHDELLFIICVDITLSNILKMVHPTSIDSFAGKILRISYAAFSVALAAVALLLFFKGIGLFLSFGVNIRSIDINDIFQATILLTLSLAIFDLVKAIFEEEVLGKVSRNQYQTQSHKTMIRFLGSIIIALSIEALMLVFKFALTSPDKLVYAVLLIGGVAILLISLSLYMKFSKSGEPLEERHTN